MPYGLTVMAKHMHPFIFNFLVELPTISIPNNNIVFPFHRDINLYKNYNIGIESPTYQTSEGSDPALYDGKIIECSFNSEKNVWVCMWVRVDELTPMISTPTKRYFNSCYFTGFRRKALMMYSTSFQLVTIMTGEAKYKGQYYRG